MPPCRDLTRGSSPVPMMRKHRGLFVAVAAIDLARKELALAMDFDPLRSPSAQGVFST